MMSSVFHQLNCNEIIVDNLSPSHSRRLGGRKMRFVMRRSNFFGGHSIRGLSWQTSSYHFSSTLPGAFVEQKQSWEYYTIMFSFNLLTKKPSKACELGENENRDEAIVCGTIGCFLYFLPRGIISAVTNNNLQFTLQPSVDAKKQHYAINGLDTITAHDEKGAISFKKFQRLIENFLSLLL